MPKYFYFLNTTVQVFQVYFGTFINIEYYQYRDIVHWVSIFWVSSSGLYNYPYLVGHALYKSLTSTDSNLTPFIDQCLMQFIKVMTSCILNCFSKISSQMLNGIAIRTMWRSYKTTHVLVRFPLLNNVSSEAWRTNILENEVVSTSQQSA